MNQDDFEREMGYYSSESRRSLQAAGYLVVGWLMLASMALGYFLGGL